MGRLSRAYGWFDDRLDLGGAQTFLGKAFPAEDSYLLGEVAAICFLILVLTGIFLGFFFEPSTSDVEYEGSVAQFQGEEMPEAFVSVLNITYDVPFGMLIRRMHHWAAHLFIAAIGLHMLRVFFTGAYRNPREPNWVVGTGLAGLSMFAAYTGYALPFDEFASTAAGIGYNIAVSVPIVGEALGQIVFGGDFPSSATIPRLYFLHVLLLPIAIAGLLGLHMLILIRQKHTEAPREADVPGRKPTGDHATSAAQEPADGDGPAAATGHEAADGDGPAAATGPETADGDGDASTAGHEPVDREDDSVVVGLPMVPNQAAVTAVVFFLTLATLSLLAGFLPVHNIAEYGPMDPASTPSLVMPDWFLMWGYGFLKLTPAWLSFDVLGVHVSAEFIGGLVLPGLVFAAVLAWPFVDYEAEPVHFGADPLARPFQTAVGVAAVVFVMVASIAGMDVIVAEILHTSTAALKPYLIGLLVLAPLLAGAITYAVLGGVGDGGSTAGPPGGDRRDDDARAAADEDDGSSESTAVGDGGRVREGSP